MWCILCGVPMVRVLLGGVCVVCVVNMVHVVCVYYVCCG